MNTEMIFNGILLGCWTGIGTWNLRKKKSITRLDYNLVWLMTLTHFVDEILELM